MDIGGVNYYGLVNSITVLILEGGADLPIISRLGRGAGVVFIETYGVDCGVDIT